MITSFCSSKLSRRGLLQTFGAAALPALLGRNAAAQPRPDNFSGMVQNMARAPVTSAPVRGGVHVLAGPGGNIGILAGEEDTFMIDSGVAGAHERIVAAIAKLTAKPVRVLFNTHWHFDHTDGNEKMKALGVEIVAHENVRKRMSSPQYMALMNHTFEPAPKAALPAMLFRDSMSLELNGEQVRLISVPPAHTDGDAFAVFANANVIHTGDLFFNAFFPVIDQSTGGGITGMISAAARVLAAADNETRIIPGHGPIATKAEYAAFRDMLATCEDRIGKLVRQGKTVKEIVAEKPLADLEPKWGRGMFNGAAFARIVALSLTAPEL